MFTGIIEQTGTLISLNETGGVRRITVEARDWPAVSARAIRWASPAYASPRST